VTAKSSIRLRDVLYKSGVYAGKVLCLTPGDLPDTPRIVACDENWLRGQ
jgi:hypothetical protein